VRYVGLDVHFRQSTLCVLDHRGQKLLSRTIKGPWSKVLEEVGRVRKPFAVCFEASTGYGHLFERLQSIARRVVVAHPGQLRLIFRSKRKNDRVDAEKLAKLLFLDEVPPVYVPSSEVRAWRSFIEHRYKLVCERTRTKNAIRAPLRGHGIQAPRGLWYGPGMRWLRTVSFANELDTVRRDMLYERLCFLTKMIERVEVTLARVSRCNPGVQLLRTIPGVGPRTAEAVMAWVDDPSRFQRIKSAGRYFGLVPCQDASARNNRLGHITREGPSTVRWMLTEAAWQGVRRCPVIRTFYERVRRDDPERRKIALTATAHYLLRVMMAMLRTGEVWRSSKQAAA
jgi:transposase